MGVLIRRRTTESAEAWLWLVLAYAWNDWSLRPTAAGAAQISLANLSDVAVLNRLRHAHAWLGYLLDRWGHEHGIETTTRSTRFRLVITDGTTAPEPGSHGCPWRRISDALTPAPARCRVGRPELCQTRALARMVDQHADVIARFGWNALRRETLGGAHLARCHARLVVAIRKSPAAAEQGRRKAAKDPGNTVSAATWEAADILALYRLRWPIDCAVKRLQSVLSLGHLRARPIC